MSQAGPADPVPTGMVLLPDDDLRTVDRGRLLIGGSPFAITRLTRPGADLVSRWFGGVPVSESTSHRRLARRLVAAGMAHPDWTATGQAPSPTGSVTVVIPVKDDPEGLAETLAGLLGQPGVAVAGHGGRRRIVVVDDGSFSPVDLDRLDLGEHDLEGTDIDVIRCEQSGGPGAARQRGMAEVVTPFVAFVDAGVTIDWAVITGLLAEFEDADVVAAAPRIMTTASTGLVGRYEQHRSPLDLGPLPSPVGPGRRVPYVPTACLVAGAEAVRRAGGFDINLRYGEDVDLVWRLGRTGSVRYRPDLHVGHPPRPTVAAFVEQRRRYGSAAGPLATRHGQSVAPARTSPLGFAPLALVVGGHPVAALLAAGATAVKLRNKMTPLPDKTSEAVVLTARGQWHGALGLLTAAVRAWLPVLVAAAALMPRQRRALGALVALGFGRRLLDGPRAPTDSLVDVGLGIVDDTAYCVGLWEGAWNQRSPRSLLPVVSSPSVASTRR